MDETYRGEGVESVSVFLNVDNVRGGVVIRQIWYQKHERNGAAAAVGPPMEIQA